MGLLIAVMMGVLIALKGAALWREGAKRAHSQSGCGGASEVHTLCPLCPPPLLEAVR